MYQPKPEHLQSSTTSIPIIGLALLFVIASFFVATTNAHSADITDQSAAVCLDAGGTLPGSQR